MAEVKKINQKLHLIIPVHTQTGIVNIHSTPLSREAFEQNYLVLSKTFAAIYGEGLGFVAGPRVALLLLRDIAKRMGDLTAASVELGIISEMRRLTNAVLPSGEAVPFQEIVDKTMLDEEDLAEVENAIAFFTVASAIHKREELKEMLDGASRIWGGQVSYLSFTDYLASLKTSTKDATSGVKAPPLSQTRLAG
jgi:hypothetical protein